MARTVITFLMLSMLAACDVQEVFGPDQEKITTNPTASQNRSPLLFGRVELDGQPQEGAVVSTPYGSAITGADGMYVLDLAAPISDGSTVRFGIRTRTGYQKFFDRYVASREDRLQMDFALFLSPTALIQVIGPDGRGLQNAAVSIWKDGRPERRTKVSGADGKTQFDNLEPGIYVVGTAKDGLSFTETKIEVTDIGMETTVIGHPVEVQLNKSELVFGPLDQSKVLTLTADNEITVQLFVESAPEAFQLHVDNQVWHDAKKLTLKGSVAVRVALLKDLLPAGLSQTHLTVLWDEGALTVPIRIISSTQADTALENETPSESEVETDSDAANALLFVPDRVALSPDQESTVSLVLYQPTGLRSMKIRVPIPDAVEIRSFSPSSLWEQDGEQLAAIVNVLKDSDQVVLEIVVSSIGGTAFTSMELHHLTELHLKAQSGEVSGMIIPEVIQAIFDGTETGRVAALPYEVK
jgi:hypothetical protein